MEDATMLRVIAIRWVLAALVLCAISAPRVSGGEFKTDNEGFIQNWLMLATIPIPEGQGATDVEKEQIKDEGKLAPKDGEKIKVRDKELTWTAVATKDYYVDFNEILKHQHEDVCGYLVCYAEAADEMKDLVLAVGSNDFCKVYLNGKEALKYLEPGQIEKDKTEASGITLKKGVNTIVFKVINDKNNWQGALRFKTKDGKAVTALKIKLAP
jgi:hypothetical protein